MAGEWLVRLANFENFKHCVVVEFHIRVGESYCCSSCVASDHDAIVKLKKNHLLKHILSQHFRILFFNDCHH